MRAFASALLGLGLLLSAPARRPRPWPACPSTSTVRFGSHPRVDRGPRLLHRDGGFATAKGIVVIDTTGDPVVDRELRRIIARELGRDDFAVLINTHEHDDHTGGNAVYADCEIVGHELVGPAMASSHGEGPRRIEWGERRVAELEKQVAALAADDADGPRLREELAVSKMHLATSRQRRATCRPRGPSPITWTWTWATSPSSCRTSAACTRPATSPCWCRSTGCC